MMARDMSIRAREKYVEIYIADLRAKLGPDLPGFNERVIEALADMYRTGWDSADGMFRAWETE
jgi:hypothetical protein